MWFVVGEDCGFCGGMPGGGTHRSLSSCGVHSVAMVAAMFGGGMNRNGSVHVSAGCMYGGDGWVQDGCVSVSCGWVVHSVQSILNLYILHGC